MSDKQLDVTPDIDGLRKELYLTRQRNKEMAAEVERLRAREAALLEVVRAVAFDDPIQPDSGNFVCYYCCACAPYESAVVHSEHCTYEQARALLASADEAK